MADPLDHITLTEPGPHQPFDGVCGLCGCAVVDVGVHAAWHQAIRDVVTEVAHGVLDHEHLKEL